MAARRTSTVPVSKPPTHLDPKAIVSESASLTGKFLISIGANAVIHPRAKLNSSAGPITIGENCVVCERAVIGVDAKSLRSADGSAPTDLGSYEVKLGKGVCVEIGAMVEASSVGDGTIVEAAAKLRRRCVVGQNCKIGPLCEVAEAETLSDHTVLYGFNERRTDMSNTDEARTAVNELHIGALRKLIVSNLAKFQNP